VNADESQGSAPTQADEQAPQDEGAAGPGEDEGAAGPGEDEGAAGPGEDEGAAGPGQPEGAAGPGEDEGGDPAYRVGVTVGLATLVALAAVLAILIAAGVA